MAAAFQVVVISWADTASLVGGQYGGGWCQWWVIFMFTTLLLYFADDLRRRLSHVITTNQGYNDQICGPPG